MNDFNLVSTRFQVSIIMINVRKVFLFQRLFLLCCLTGCAIQLAHFVSKFIQHSVVSKVVLNYPSSLIVPDLTVCSEYVDVINYTAYLENYPNQIPSDCDDSASLNESQLRSCFTTTIGYIKMRSFIATTFTIGQFYNITYPPETIFPRINVPAKVDSDAHCSPRSMFTADRICYTLSCATSSPLTITRFTLDEGDLKGAMISIQVNQSIVRDWEFTNVYVHEATTFPYGFESSWIGLTFNRLPTLYLIKYKLIQVELLRKPYVTACRDYEEIGFANRLDYFDNCINKRSLEELGTPSHRTFIVPTSNISFPSHQLRRQSTAYQTIENECIIQISQPQCYYRFYIASNEGWYPTESQDSQIMLLAPNEPDLHAITLPEYGFYQFLLFAESILGIWFGFNHFGYGQKLFNLLYNYSKMEPKLRWNTIKKSIILGKLSPKSNLDEKFDFKRKRSSRVSNINTIQVTNKN